MSDLPFTVVEKEERRSPLKELHARNCDHNRAYMSDKYPVSGTRYICVDCGRGSTFPIDLE